MEQRVDQNASRRLDREADRKISLATVEQGERFGAAENTAHPYIESGGRDREPRQQRRQQDEGGIVRHRDRDCVIGHHRIKPIRLQYLPHEAERRRNGAGQVIGPGRRLHAGRRPDKEFVLEHLMQPGERTAHCRLAQADALSRMSDVALSIESVERLQQVQVKTGYIHRRLIGHMKERRNQPR
jgi:hypothetical protein